MKYTILTAFALVAAAQIGSAAVVTTATNFNLAGPNALLITDNTGTPLASSAYSFAVGKLDGGTFVRNGATDGAGNPAFAGAFQATLQDPATSTDGSDAFTGTNIVVQIGNGPDVASSTLFILWDTGVPWPQEQPTVGETASVNIATDGAGVAGTFVPTTVAGATGPFAQFNGQGGITFVPEPSTALLAGLAGLGLLIRRKR